MADLHAVVDGMCTDKVVEELVDINGRSRKSWDVLQSCCGGLRIEVWRKIED